MSTKVNKRFPDAPLDPPKQYRAPLGEIVLRWSRLEYQLGVLIRLIVRTSKERQYQAVLSKRTSDLCSLLLLITPGLVSDKKTGARLLSLARTVRNHEKKRNDYVHSIYEALESAMRFRVANDESGRIQGSAIAIADLQAFANTVKTLQVEAESVTDAVKDSIKQTGRP